MSNNKGFYISKLWVTGPSTKPATLSFESGFNMISGDSDTGKTYIFECIDFMLGGGNPPKEIPESKGYKVVMLEIKTYAGKTYSLSRKLSGGDFTLKEIELELFNTQGISRELQEQHNSSSDNISKFLLELCGFEEKWIRKDVYNAKRELSYRHVARLTVVDEERIVTKRSPVYVSGQYSDRTEEQSVLNTILTGKDAKNLVQVEAPKLLKSRITGKIEFIDSLIQEYLEKILESEKEDHKSKKEVIQTRINELTGVLLDSSINLEMLTIQKQELFNKITEIESQSLFHEELQSRFLLLREHYRSDLNRLEFVTEGESLFSQLNTIKCPLCAGDMDKDHYDCMIDGSPKTASIIESIEKEAAKIKIKLLDLEGTLTQLYNDKNSRDSTLNGLRNDYKSLEIKIRNNVEPIKAVTKQEIDSLIRELSQINQIENQKEQLANLYVQKGVIEREFSQKSKTKKSSDNIGDSVLKELCDQIKVILESWLYPNISVVNFDTQYKVYDFVINDKGRNAHGKGIRAITHSAFIIAILDYCIKNDLPHPRSIVIDSPLTTYHGKGQVDKSEDVDTNMQNAFFEDVSRIGKDRQVIVLDNKEPRESLQSKINYIRFTDDLSTGRQGFFPK